MVFLRRLWEGWKKIARKIGDFQARILLGIFYFLILGPLSLFINLTKDVLAIRPGANPRWKTLDPDETPPMERASRQF